MFCVYIVRGGKNAIQRIDSETADISAAEEAADELLPESTAKEALQPEASLGLEKAVYKDGKLTVEINGTLPEDTKTLPYSIKEAAADKTLGEGTLDEILEKRDPMTLDISSLDLPKGTYTLQIGEESCSFTA